MAHEHTVKAFDEDITRLRGLAAKGWANPEYATAYLERFLAKNLRAGAAASRPPHPKPACANRAFGHTPPPPGNAAVSTQQSREIDVAIGILQPLHSGIDSESLFQERFVAITGADWKPAIGRVGTNFRVSSPRLYVNVNRERAKALGIPISDIFDTLQAYFGNFYINDFVKFGRVYHVQTEAEAEYRATPQDLAKIYVRAQTPQGTNMITLDTVVTTEYQSGPDPVNHFNGYNTALVLGAAAPGFSSGQALEALTLVLEETARVAQHGFGEALDLGLLVGGGQGVHEDEAAAAAAHLWHAHDSARDFLCRDGGRGGGHRWRPP